MFATPTITIRDIANDSEAVTIILDPERIPVDRSVARAYLMRTGGWTLRMLDQLDAQREGIDTRPQSAKTHRMAF